MTDDDEPTDPPATFPNDPDQAAVDAIETTMSGDDVLVLRLEQDDDGATKRWLASTEYADLDEKE